MNHKEIAKLNKMLGLDISKLGNALDIEKLEAKLKYDKEEEAMNQRNARLKARSEESEQFFKYVDKQALTNYVANLEKTNYQESKTYHRQENANADLSNVEITNCDHLKKKGIYNKDTGKMELVPVAILKAQPKQPKTKTVGGLDMRVIKRDKDLGIELLVDNTGVCHERNIEDKKQARLIRKHRDNKTTATVFVNKNYNVDIDYTQLEEDEEIIRNTNFVLK